jgi:hypothetical protein
MPAYSTYFCRFGSIRHAYSKIGYFPAPVRFVRAETEKRSRALRDRLIDSVRGLFPRLSTVGNRPVLRLPSGTTISILFGRRTPTLAEPTWRVDPKSGQGSGLTLLCLTGAKCSHIVRICSHVSSATTIFTLGARRAQPGFHTSLRHPDPVAVGTLRGG